MNFTIKREWLNLTIEKKVTVKDFFDFYHISKKMRASLLQNEEVYCNHLPIKNENEVIEPKQQLRLKIFKKEKIDYIPENLFPLDVIYEDAFCLIINKPSGYIVHEERGSVANVIAHYYKQNKIFTPVRHIHRLDKETNGLLFYSKCPFFQSYFDFLLSEKKIHRDYYALVEGNTSWQQFTCTSPIGKDRHVNNKYRVSSNGKSATTHFNKIKNIEDKTLLLCTLETGRTHQIRVHLASLGHPIYNDAIYGTITSDAPMGLSAYSLTWLHPITQEILHCKINEPY